MTRAPKGNELNEHGHMTRSTRINMVMWPWPHASFQVMNWLSTYNTPKYDDLVAQYQVTAQTAYQKVLREFFDDKRCTVTRKSTEKILTKFGTRKSELALSQKMMNSSTQLHSQTSLTSGHSTASLDSQLSSRSESDFSISHGGQFETSVRDTLDFVELAVSKEEEFIHNFFQETRSGQDRADMVEVVLCRFVSSTTWDITWYSNHVIHSRDLILCWVIPSPTLCWILYLIFRYLPITLYIRDGIWFSSMFTNNLFY